MDEELRVVLEKQEELSSAIKKLCQKLIKFEDVRKELAEISKQGKTSEMKALLSKYGAKRLSDVNAKDYGEILTAAKEIANA